MARKSTTRQAAEANVKSERIRPPSTITKQGRKIFRDIVGSFDPARFIQSDAMFLAEYCEAHADLIEVRKQWRDMGAPFLDHEGGIHPLRKTISDIQGRLSVMATKLRLVPVGRIRNDAKGATHAAPAKAKSGRQMFIS